MVIDMPHGSVLRIEPVKANRDDTLFECVADNGIGEAAVASASLTVYPEGSGKYIFVTKFQKSVLFLLYLVCIILFHSFLFLRFAHNLLEEKNRNTPLVQSRPSTGR